MCLFPGSRLNKPEERGSPAVTPKAGSFVGGWLGQAIMEGMGEVIGILDLSVPIQTGMTIFPGDPPADIRPALAFSKGDAVNVLSIHFGSHSGTHLDAPYHVFKYGAKLNDLPLNRFIGPAVVADLRGIEPEHPIEWMHLAAVHGALRASVILLLHTGWSRHWTDASQYRTHPWLTGDAATQIMSTGVKTVGIDALNVDATPEDLSESRFDAHIAILGADGVIVEKPR
jgi:kynurenine formamidase